jgi:hypothetical protein
VILLIDIVKDDLSILLGRKKYAISVFSFENLIWYLVARAVCCDTACWSFYWTSDGEDPDTANIKSST